MPFIPNTDNDRKEMLKKIGVSSFDDLIGNIPANLRLKGDLNLPPQLSEYEAFKLLESLSSLNKSAINNACFMGGGSYDHYVPAMVTSIIDRPEFRTAYTPYQAEVSQGTLQVMYEFQSMVCALTGMDVANASMYDGGTAIAESCLLASTHNNRKEILIAGSINPQYKKVMETVTCGKKLVFRTIAGEDGTCDLKALASEITDATSAVVVQHPNVYGNLEDVFEIGKIAHSKNALYISVFDPISLGMLASPGEYDADIAVAEGQSLGIPMSYGGPYLGLFTSKQQLVRKIPGRLSGVSKDADGNRAFVLTLQTREQQIKREKATSNICSNEGLMMLAASVYMTVMGKQGIKDVAEQSFEKAHYLAKEISRIGGFSLLNDKPFFKEFLVKTPVKAAAIIEEAAKDGILAGIDTSRFKECKEGLLVAVTEKRTIEEMNKFIEVLKKFAK